MDIYNAVEKSYNAQNYEEKMTDEQFKTDVVVRLTRIESKLNNGITEKQSDHEKRIRYLERGLYLGLGGLLVIQVLINIIIK